MDLQREVERLFNDTMRHPLLFWPHWEDFVRRHQLGPREADALLWNRRPPERPEPPVADSFPTSP